MPLQDLNKIVNACVDAIFPLLNAFLILFMFTLVCAILGPSPFPRRLSASLWRARIRACSQARLQHLVAFSLVHPLRSKLDTLPGLTRAVCAATRWCRAAGAAWQHACGPGWRTGVT